MELIKNWLTGKRNRYVGAKPSVIFNHYATTIQPVNSSTPLFTPAHFPYLWPSNFFGVKLRSAILIILMVILADQALKIWIKTSFPFGHVTNVLGFSWSRLYFIENEGMAWGWKFGGNWGKMLLTLFRLVAVLFGSWYLVKIVREGYTKGFIVCASLIYAGALGNLIDSLFYGMFFSQTTYTTVASAFPLGGGYAGFLHGHVVDMLYFPIIHSNFPLWLPLIGGKEFEFFSPIFNIADASISTGVLVLLLFQKKFFHKEEAQHTDSLEEAPTEIGGNAHVA